ncbi:MAG: hypothetical protein ACYC2G_09025 [Gemmatimonadaceae bacterium]
MTSAMMTTIVVIIALAAVIVPLPAAAQQWDEPAARALAERATARRAEQIADTLLHDYTATANGFLTFLAQVGEGFPDPPRIVKADQLAVRVYWLAPDQSRQVLVGRRDTLLLPADVGYYRDRYGIIQNNFPDRIRMGDGNDVRDVPHPLSAAGLRVYQFARGDSLRIRLPDRVIEVDEVKFRPVDASQPRAVGTLYVDRETAAVVRMALTFTRAAILDRRIETLAVTLENGLVEGRFWLPHRQELEVARTSTWLDFPARGIIRGRWEVGGYEVNQGLTPGFFGGSEIVSESPRALADYPFDGALLDQVPDDVQAVTEADVERVRTQAEALVRQQMLERATGATLAARRISDFIRVNRVEGLALGAGTRWRATPTLTAALRARYGIADARLKGRLSLARLPDLPASPGSVELFAERDHREAGDAAETSLARNSLAAQEFGSDYTDPYEVRAVGVGAGLGELAGIRWRAEGAWEEQRAVAVHAAPSSGRYEPTIPVSPLAGARLALFADRLLDDGPLGTRLRWSAELRGGLWERGSRTLRLAVAADAERPLGNGQLVLATTAAALTGSAVSQQLAYLGGPVTGPGYAFHSLAGRVGVSQRVEWRTPLPFVGIPVGRFGRTPASMMLAPYIHASAIGGPVALPGRPAAAGGVYPSVGVGGLFFFDLLRVDVARGLRDGRWLLGVDVSRTLWRIF